MCEKDPELLKQAREKYFNEIKTDLLRSLEMAFLQSSFYKKLPISDLDFNQIHSYKDFYEKIPLTSQENLVNMPQDFVCNKKDIVFERQSSATSGNIKTIFLTQKDLDNWTVNGSLTLTPYFRPGMLVAHSKREEKYYLSGLDEAIEFSGGRVLAFNPKDSHELKSAIERADIILDYSEMLYYISEKAKQLSKTNKVNRSAPLTLVYTGELLLKEDIEAIQSNFAAIGVSIDIYSEYALSEIGPIACSYDGKKPHIHLPIYKKIAFVEVLDDLGKPALDGEIVVTTLNREGSNLIRYKTGDLAQACVYKNEFAFYLKGRKSGVKFASLFLHPNLIVGVLRQVIKQEFFVYIFMRKEAYKGEIHLKVVAPQEPKGGASYLKDYLLKHLEYTDDIDATIDFSLELELRDLTETEIRKAYAIIN